MQFIDKNIENYAVSKSNRGSNILEDLAKYTQENTQLPQMLTGKMEMAFMGFLIHSLNVKKVLEFGTFTGYSALAIAENLPFDGKVITLDIDPKTSEIAKSYWNKSDHGAKITQILGPALESVQKIDEKFDLVFIDADKTNYLNYLKASLERLSSTGVIVVDNTLWSGKVLDPKKDDTSTQAIVELNDFVANNENLYGCLLPVRDGMFLIKPLNIS